MKRIQMSALALACLGLTSIAFAEDVKVGGGAAPIENIFKKIQEPLKGKGIQLTLNTDGPYQAFIDLEAGKLDAAAAGLEMKDWLEMMSQKGHAITNANAYKSRVVGRDRIHVLLNTQVNVRELNKDQLKKIFTGEAKSWKEFGGPDLPIVVVYSAKIPGTNKLWEEKIMDKQPWAANKKTVDGDTVAIKQAISSTPGAVGIGPMAAEKDLYAPKTPEIGRPITVITKGVPSATMLKVFDFITHEGGKYIVR